MKKYKIVAVAIGLLLFSGCHEDFLQDRAYSIITEDNFFRTASDAVTAVNGVYRTLREGGMYHTDIMMLNEYPSELVTTRLNIGAAQSNMDVWEYQVGYFSGIYSGAYRLIERANQVIANVPRADMPEPLRARVIGEATYLRALAYFNLVRVYGGVPLKLTPTTDFKTVTFSRATASEVYQQIIDDLSSILTSDAVPKRSAYGVSDRGRVGRSAVQALLGKTYLTRATETFGTTSDFQKAVEVLQTLVNEGDQSLLPAYTNVFSMTNENNAEIIFDVQNIRQAGLGGNLTAFVATGTTRELYIIPYYDYPANIDFYQSFEPGDTRRPVTFHDRMKVTINNVANIEVYFDSESDPYVGTWRRTDDNTLVPRSVIENPVPGFRKFIDNDPLARGDAEEPNYVILRYSDVLLMLAEALNEVNNGPNADAYNYLNMVKRRAFGKAINSPDVEVDYAGLTKDGFRRALYSERRKELVMEGHSWFDGKRFWEIYTEKVAAASVGADPNINNRPKVVIDLNRIRQDKYKLMPFSITQLELNTSLNQNPGWEAD